MTTPTNGPGDNDWGQYPYNPQYGNPQPGYGAPQQFATKDSFWTALFDFSFTRYATPSIIKLAYGLGFAMIALAWVIMVLSSIIGLTSEEGGAGFVLGLVTAAFITVAALFAMMSMRMMLEFYLSNIRIAQAAQSIEQQRAAGR